LAVRDASGSGDLTNNNKLGILVELEMRKAIVESKIQVAHEDYEREATHVALEFRQKILAITWNVFVEELRLFLTDFRDSKTLLSGEIARLGYDAPPTDGH
jgi:hypothetical protein